MNIDEEAYYLLTQFARNAEKAFVAANKPQALKS